MKSSICCFVLLVCAPSLLAQTSSTASRRHESNVQKNAAREGAMQAFRADNPALAVARLQAALDTGRGAKDADFQLAVDLLAVSARFKNSADHGRASAAASLAIQRVAAAQSRVNVSDRAVALALAGQAYDYFLHDPTSAKTAYQQALALNPRMKAVAERLSYLNSVDVLASEKTTANDAIRQRAGGR